MASVPDPDDVLCSTSGKTNFQRLTRLLISGGTTLLREIFDLIFPPSNLPTILKNPATVKQLKAAKLTKPQWDCLYPSPGKYGSSIDFDVTLLFRLLRTICKLIPPTTGWDALPTITDHSLAADLARIKYYRNTVYGHVNQNMEVTGEEFLLLWQEISEALVRIAGQISPAKEKEWQDAIDKFLQDPLTVEDERNVEELERWYENEKKVKKAIEELKVLTQEGIDHMEMIITDVQMKLEGKSQVNEEKLQCLEKAVQKEAQDVKDKLGGELKNTARDVQCLGNAVREEAKDIKDQLGEEMKSTIVEVQCLEKAVREEAQDIKEQLGDGLKSATQEVQCLEKAVREEAQDIKDQLGGELKSTTQEVQCLKKAVEGIEHMLVHFIDSPSSSAVGPQSPNGQGKIY